MTIIRVIDTETVDFDGGCVEIASVDVVDGVICNPMNDLVKPVEKISYEAMAIHHITEEMVVNAPPISDVIDKYLGADVYAAHNAAFDRSKLPQITAPWICTLKLARKLWPEGKHGNQYLRYALGLNPYVPLGLHAHRALYDCYVTAALLIHINSVGRYTIGEMREITNAPSLLHSFHYGKHKGKTYAEVADTDVGYFRWLLTRDDLSEDEQFTVMYYMEKFKHGNANFNPR